MLIKKSFDGLNENFNQINDQIFELNNLIEKLVSEAIDEIQGQIEALPSDERSDSRIKYILGFDFDRWDTLFLSPENLSDFLETYKKRQK